MKPKKEKKIKAMNIGMMMALVLANLLTGSPLRYHLDVLNLVINVIAIVAIVISIRKGEKLSIQRFDVFVILFSFSFCIPLITGTYLSLIDTVEYILRYLSALNIFFLLRQYVKLGSPQESKILSTMVGMSIVLILMGMDMMLWNVGKEFYNFIKAPILVSESKTRMMSLMKYPNAFGAYLCMNLFLTLGLFCKASTMRQKSVYGCFVFLQLFAILMTYSRLCWGMVFILLLALLVVLPEHRKKICKVIGISFGNAFLYFVVFQLCREKGLFAIAWLTMLLPCALEVILLSHSFVINKKHVMQVAGAIGALAITIMLIIIAIAPKELTLYTHTNSKHTYCRENIAVEGNKEYTMCINLDSVSPQKDNFKISVKQHNESEKFLKEEEIVFDTYTGEKKLTFTTLPDTTSVWLLFKCVNPSEETKLTVHSVQLNNIPISFYFRGIPIALVNRLGKLTLHSGSLQQRGIYVKEAWRIFTTSPWSGLGGYAWKDAAKNAMALDSIAEHCYPLQLLMQNGFLSVFFYGGIWLWLILRMREIYRKKESDKIFICFALFFMLCHSMLDFDMYFQIMVISLFLLLAFIQKEEKPKTLPIAVSYGYAILLVITLYCHFGEVVTLHWDTSKYKEDYQRLNAIEWKIRLSPYYYRFYEDKINCLSTIHVKGLPTYQIDLPSEMQKCVDFITLWEKKKDSSACEKAEKYLEQMK